MYYQFIMDGGMKATTNLVLLKLLTDQIDILVLTKYVKVFEQ
jgi:hypothetical protein